MNALVITAAAAFVFGCGAVGASGTTGATGGAQVDGREEPVETPARLLDDDEAARTHTQAMQSHVRARALRTECESDADADACHAAEDLFRVAADTWRALVDGRPGDDAHPEWHFMLAQASFHAGRFEAAASAAERYLETGAEEWRVQSARTLVEAREQVIARDIVAIRQEPPDPAGQPLAVVPLGIPDEVQRLFDARARYVEVVAAADDPERLARRYALDNALLLHLYGHWERATPALRAAFESGCRGEAGWEGGKAAFRARRAEALALGRYDAVRSIGEELSTLDCDFGGTEGGVSCTSESDHPVCLARLDRVSGHLLSGRRFMQRAEHARGREQRQWALRAGDAFLEAMDGRELEPAERITALVEAGRAYRMAESADKAAAVDARIIREVDPSASSPQSRAYALVTVASALTNQLDAAIRDASPGVIVRLAEQLLGDDYDLPELSEERSRARRALPDALTALGRRADAARALTALSQAATDPAEAREAQLAAALALTEGGSCQPSVRPLEAFVREHGARSDARDQTIAALFAVAECQRGRPRTATLARLVAVAQAGGALSADARSHFAAATFESVQVDVDQFARTRIRLPRVDTVEDIVGALRAALEEPISRAEAMVEAYAEVEAIGDARFASDAKYEAARVLLALEQIVRSAEWQIPNDLQRQRRDLNRPAFEQLEGIVAARVAQIIEAEATPIHCRAGEALARAVSGASRQNVESERISAARAALRADPWPRCTFRR